MKQHLLAWTTGCCALLALYGSHAAAPADGELTLDEALARVLEHNPTLQAAGYDSRAAAARIRQAAQANPWRAGLELENLAGTGTTRGTDALETTLSLSRVLQTGDQPRLRGELARQEAALLGTEQQAQRLDLLAESAQRFIAVAAAQERIQLARDARTAAQRSLEVVEHRVQAGRSAQAERATAAIALARAGLELAGAESELQSARQTLAAGWGDTRAAYTRVTADLYDLPAVMPFATLEAALARNPELARFATAERVSEVRVRLARAGRSPDIELAAGVRYLNEPDDAALVLSASVPLGTARRAAPAIDEAEAQRLREPLAYEERRLALHSLLFTLHQELRQQHAAAITLRERIIPAAEQALADYRRGYSAGRYGWLELVNAQNTLRDVRTELLDTAAAFHRTRIEIERLTGGKLITGDAS
ncbi:MAG: TolC family protein [Gammaproteobacteria bacterium]|jgi:cobalt-zinc-cadmium efflux system outer membrane protein